MTPQRAAKIVKKSSVKINAAESRDKASRRVSAKGTVIEAKIDERNSSRVLSNALKLIKAADKQKQSFNCRISEDLITESNLREGVQQIMPFGPLILGWDWGGGNQLIKKEKIYSSEVKRF